MALISEHKLRTSNGKFLESKNDAFNFCLMYSLIKASRVIIDFINGFHQRAE